MSWTRKYPQPSIFLLVERHCIFFFYNFSFRVHLQDFSGKSAFFFSSKTKKQTFYDSINTYERGFSSFFIYILLMLQNLGLLSLCRLLWLRDLLDFLPPFPQTVISWTWAFLTAVEAAEAADAGHLAQVAADLVVVPPWTVVWWSANCPYTQQKKREKIVRVHSFFFRNWNVKSFNFNFVKFRNYIKQF